MAYTQGSVDVAAIFNGRWADVRANAAGPGTVYSLGAGPDAVLTIEQTVSEHRDTGTPSVIDTVLPQDAGMTFEVTIEEHRIENWNVLLGELPATAGNFRFPGTRVKSNYVTITANRQRNQDSLQIIAVLHRAAVTNDPAMGGSPDAVGTPIRFVATADRGNSMGSSGSSASPLGSIWLPSAVATVTGL